MRNLELESEKLKRVTKKGARWCACARGGLQCSRQNRFLRLEQALDSDFCLLGQPPSGQSPNRDAKSGILDGGEAGGGAPR